MHRAPSQKYRPFPPIDLPDRRGPSATLTRPLARDHGLALPRLLQIEFSQVVQAITDATGKELSSADILRAGTANVYGVGIDPNIVTATLKAVVAALDRALAQGAVRIGAPHRAAAA
jgi:2-isopropylmalate synthase